MGTEKIELVLQKESVIIFQVRNHGMVKCDRVVDQSKKYHFATPYYLQSEFLFYAMNDICLVTCLWSDVMLSLPQIMVSQKSNYYLESLTEPTKTIKAF